MSTDDTSQRRSENGSTSDGDIDTGGGAFVGGDVSVGEGGVLIGRDSIIYNVRADVGLYYFATADAFDRFTRDGGGPYKYLSPYQTEDAGIFHGRQSAIRELLERIRRQEHTLLWGRPGVGKSSLINAGLMPPLLRQGWLVLRVGGYGYPTSMLRLALDVERVQVPLTETADLCALISATLKATGQPLAIFFDQFERFLLNLPETERRRFVEEFALCHSLDWHGRVRFVFAVRSDFFSDMGSTFQQRVPEILDGSYVLTPMTRDEARLAILEPVVGRAVHYDHDFVDQVLLAHLDDQDQRWDTIYPPHIQIVCQALYEEALKQHTDITRHLYRSLGGAQHILGDYLEQEVAKFGLQERSALRDALKQMVSAHGTRVFRSSEELARALSQDTARLQALLEKLVTARLLEVREEEDVAFFCLSHEYMVPEVQSWFSEKEWAQRRAREMLARAWADWDATGRLLVEPRRLSWLRRVRSHLTLTPDQLCLLLRSAVHFEQHPAYWVGEMAIDGPARDVIEQLAAGAAEEAVVERAMRALGMVDSDGVAYQTLPHTVVGHPSGKVRRSAALALAALGGDDALKALRPQLEGGIRSWLRALWALSHIRAAGVSSPWPSLFAIPIEMLMLGWIRLWAGRARLALLAVGAGVGGGLTLGLQSLLVLVLGMPGWQGAVYTYLTAGAILGGLTGGLIAALQDVLVFDRPIVGTVRDVLGLALAFALAQAVFAPLTPGVQPFWSGLAANVLVGLGMALPWVRKSWAARRGVWTGLLGGAGAAAGAALGRIIGVLMAPVLPVSDVTRMYLFPALDADTVNVALRNWGLGDTVSLSVLAVLLQALTGLLLGLGLMSGITVGQLIGKQLRKEGYDA